MFMFCELVFVDILALLNHKHMKFHTNKDSYYVTEIFQYTLKKNDMS